MTQRDCFSLVVKSMVDVRQVWLRAAEWKRSKHDANCYVCFFLVFVASRTEVDERISRDV